MQSENELPDETLALSNIGPTLTDAPYKLVVPIRWQKARFEPSKEKRTLLDKILKRPVPMVEIPQTETHRTFEISPCLLGNMYRIASRAALLPKEIYGGEAVAVLFPLIPIVLPHLVYMVGAAIQNNHLEPDPELLLFIERNFTQSMIHEALVASIEGVDLQVFYNSIASVKGTINIINPEASPSDGSGSIASHTEA
jgi:hypothetical protein